MRQCFVLIPLAIFAANVLNANASLEDDFVNPPDATKPRCYWYWMDNRITKEGITEDLEAMKQIGIGEGYIGIIGGQSTLPPITEPRALTDDWWSYIEHAIREGGRLGVDIGLFNSPGWSQSGGPWVKPNQTMRYVALSEVRLHGPQHFSGKLPAPTDEFQDLAVIAFPAPAGEGDLAKITAHTSSQIQFEMPTLFTARSLTVQPAEKINVTAEFLASDDGREYRSVKKFAVDRHNLGAGVGPVRLAPVVESFPAVTARFFRLNFSAACAVADVQLSAAAKVDSFAEKSLVKSFQNPHPPYAFYTWPAQTEPASPNFSIAPASVCNVSKNMAADGVLQWDVPAGDWIVLRSGLAPTGARNGPAPPEATGLEVDKMNRTALRAHFDAYVGDLLRRMPAAERTAWKHVVADSYEQGPENWTDGFATYFKKTYGYDPLPWLPVLTGRVVGSEDKSDRFLWDLRRLVADRVARDYVGGLRDLCHEHGLKMWLENYGHFGFPAEFLQYGGACDEIAGEFWANGNYDDNSDFEYLGRIELADAASAAHIYAKKQVFAEAFTGGPPFVNAPRDLKARGDWALCEGINQFVFHVYIHQPWDDKVPGINAWFGTEFNRHNTWFAQGRAWVDYLRRCTVMLQAGQPVSDVAYFISEDAPKMAGLRQPELPYGRDFDYINAEVIEKNLTVKNGLLALPFGVNYRVLVLPEQATMRPELLKKLRELVKAGATIVGTPPSRSPSLKNFPQADEKVRQLAREIWGDTNLAARGQHDFGKGRVIWGKPLEEIFAAMDVPPDFQSSTRLRFKHRHDGDTEIYFVANPESKTVVANVAFRIIGKTPELWLPDSGKMESPAVVDEANGLTRMPLELGPAGSVFVIFRKKTEAVPQIVSVTHNGEVILQTDFKPFTPLAVAAPSADSPNDFTFALWAKPTAATGLTQEQGSGNASPSLRNEVFEPPHGSVFGGEKHAGCGLCVGTNGVCVLEHGANYLVPTLVFAAPLTNWTHVAVVYRHGQAILFLNGAPVYTGLQSTHIVHSGAGRGAAENFAGELGEIQKFSRALGDDEIAALAKSMPLPASVTATGLPAKFLRTMDGHLEARIHAAGEYAVKYPNGETQTINVSSVPAPMPVTGPWEVSFAPGLGAPDKVVFNELTDWTKRGEPGIKYFSGKATYRKTIEITADQLKRNATLILDLGNVADLATVRVNDRELTTLWNAPWQLDITSALQHGANSLEITVANCWNNRLAGDAALPEAERRTFISTPSVRASAKLRPSGLLGPVVLRSELVLKVK